MNEVIFAKVKDILTNVDNQRDISEHLVPYSEWASLGLDSLQTIEFILAIEDTFDFEVPDDDLLAQNDWMQTVSSVVDYIEKRAGG